MELHASVKHVKRSEGRSSVAAAAYRFALKIEDERTGLIHNYTRKKGVEHAQSFAPDHAPEWVHDPAKLWNAVEARERHVKAETAHELEVAFPHEFTPAQRHEAGADISRELVRRYGCAVSIAHHLPSPDGDERNFHAHILFTTRSFDSSAQDGWKKTKYRDLSQDTKHPDKSPVLDENGHKTTRGREELLSLREFTASAMNRIAKRDHVPVFVNHLSFEKRAIDREPTQHMGHKSTSMERRGDVSRVGEKNRDIEASNAQRLKDRAYEAVLSAQVSMQEDLLNTWAEEKRQNLSVRLRNAQIDLYSKHRHERDELHDRQKTQNQDLRRTIVGQLQTINRRLDNATGARKIIRNLLGKTRADRAALHQLQKALQAVRVAEQVQRKELKRRQQRERDQFVQRETVERQNLDRKIEQREPHQLTLKERLKAEYQRSAEGRKNQRKQERKNDDGLHRKPH